MSDEKRVIRLAEPDGRAYGEPEPRVVEYLEELLEEAKAGDVVGICVVKNMNDGKSFWATRGIGVLSINCVGALHVMAGDVTSETGKHSITVLDEEDEDPPDAG